MAELSLGDALSSKPFRFIVGKEKQELFIHSAAVARQSRALNVLVNGEMKEATDGCATWEHVDVETFIRFSQYIYTGSYDLQIIPEVPVSASSMKFSKDASGSKGWAWELEEPKASEKPQFDDTWGDLLAPTAKKKKKKLKSSIVFDEPEVSLPKTETLWHDFQQKQYGCCNEGPHLTNRNDNAKEKYKDELISHARLHAFADYYDIDNLAQLTLHKLHQTLTNLKLDEEGIADVVSLLHFCYEEDGRRMLRELVVEYSVCKFETLWKSHDFQQLFADHSELSLAIMGPLVSRLR